MTLLRPLSLTEIFAVLGLVYTAAKTSETVLSETPSASKICEKYKR